MKIEINLSKEKEEELLTIINKRTDGIIKRDWHRDKKFIKAIITKTINETDVLSSVLKNMGNREFFSTVGIELTNKK
jgi:hypothetical protein